MDSATSAYSLTGRPAEGLPFNSSSDTDGSELPLVAMIITCDRPANKRRIMRRTRSLQAAARKKRSIVVHRKQVCDAVAVVEHLTLAEVQRLVERSSAALEAAENDAALHQQVQSCMRFAATVSLAVDAFNEQLHANKPFEEALHRACEEYGIAQYSDRVWKFGACAAGPYLAPEDV
jgi:hypothetical protein